MRAGCVVPLFVAVAVKQSKHYAYASEKQWGLQQQFTSRKLFLSLNTFGFGVWVRRGRSSIPVKTLLYDAFHL